MEYAVMIELSLLIYRMAQVVIKTFHDFALSPYILESTQIYGHVDVVYGILNTALSNKQGHLKVLVQTYNL